MTGRRKEIISHHVQTNPERVCPPQQQANERNSLMAPQHSTSKWSMICRIREMTIRKVWTRIQQSPYTNNKKVLWWRPSRISADLSRNAYPVSLHKICHRCSKKSSVSTETERKWMKTVRGNYTKTKCLDSRIHVICYCDTMLYTCSALVGIEAVPENVPWTVSIVL